MRRAYYETGFREPLLPFARSLAAERLGDAEIRNERVAIGGQQEIFGFDVPVYDSVVVRVLQRLRCLSRDAHRFVHRELSLPVETRAQCLAFHEWHGEPE